MKFIIKYGFYWGLVGGLMSLNGCFVAKKYERPELETNDLYRNFSESDTTNIAQLPWNEFFTDVHLTDLIERAVSSNLDLKIALQQVLAAEALYKQGKQGQLPAVVLNGTVASSKFADNSALGQQFANIGDGQDIGRIEQYDLTTNISWEADIWGKIRSNQLAARASFFQNEAARRALKTRLVASVASAYYELLALDAQLKVANETVEVRKRSLETIRNLKQAGNETEVAVQQTAAQLNTAEILQISLQQQRTLLENTIRLLLADHPGKVERGVLKEQVVQQDLTLGIPSLLLRNRPDIMQAEYDLINRFELENVAKAQFYPSITINASLGMQSLALSNWMESASFFNNITGGFSQLIFNRRQIKTQYEIAVTEKKRALLAYQNSLLVAGQEVSNALLIYETELQQFEFQEQQVEALTKALDYSGELLVNGLATYLEVLRANDEKLAAELELINTKYQQLNAVVTLYEALGGGWR